MVKQAMISMTMLWTLASGLTASEVKIFRLQEQKAFLEGTLDGVSVDALGTLRLAARAERIASLEQPFVLSAASHPAGWVLGTGNDGEVVLVRRDGTVETLFVTEEPEVFAVAVVGETVWAGSSPNGHLYRWSGGEVERVVDLEQTYIWQIEPQPDGGVLVATGTEGKLFRVRAGGEVEVVWDSDDTHVRTILTRDDGTLLAGTAGEGLVVEIGTGGTVRTLYDAPEPEVVALTRGGGGSVWAAVLASEASQLPAPPAKGEDDEEDETGATAVVVVEETGVQLVGSRPPGHKGPRSEILEIHPTGAVRPVARLAEDTVFSMAWADDRLWVATGLEGRVYTLRHGHLVLENDVDERQVVALVAGREGLPALATSNASALYGLVTSRERSGTYLSPVLDAGQMARLGWFHTFDERAEGSVVRFSFRSGSSAEPDGSWSEWTPARSGNELDLSSLLPARFVQWRMEGTAWGESPSLSSVELSYRQENLAPRVDKLEVWPPGQIRVPQTFNPNHQIFEPAAPNREGIFTTLELTAADDVQRYKTLWKRGFRTLVWSASDPNEDELVYRLEVRRDAEPEGWLSVGEEIGEEHLSFDVAGIPDGVYRFRLTASDREAATAEGLEDSRQSEPVVIDHSGPEVLRTERVGDRIRIDVRDRWNPLREAQFSVDAGPWRDVETEDGLLDSRDESLWVPAGSARMLVLRVMDASFNATIVDLGTAPR